MNKTVVVLFISLAIFLIFAGCVQQNEKANDNTNAATNQADVKAAQQDLGKEASNLDSTLEDLENASADDLLNSESELDLDLDEAEIQ